MGKTAIKPRSRRIEFSDAQKAEIFQRDRATCCFSGANLWLLDAPLRPGFQRDWVDHVRPAARGGKTVVSNGVCASHTFNAKKRHNTADKSYLFQEGHPTWLYYDIFGPLTSEQTGRLARLSRLRSADWYLNRAIGQIFQGFDNRCRVEIYRQQRKRDLDHWCKAALQKLAEYRELDKGDSLEERGLITNESEFTQAWLGLRNAETEREFREIVDALFSSYRLNFRAWADYFYNFDDILIKIQKLDGKEKHTAIRRLIEKKRKALQKAESTQGLTDDTLRCIMSDFAALKQSYTDV